MNGAANAIANAEPIALASATALLQQTAHLHIQSILLTAFREKVKSEKSYLPRVLGPFPTDRAEQIFERADLTKPHPAKLEGGL